MNPAESAVGHRLDVVLVPTVTDSLLDREPDSRHLMRRLIASRIMPRTTIDLDPSVLAELKRRQRREGKSLGRLVSELLADRLDPDAVPVPHPFAWQARPMSARVDLDDAEAVRRATKA